MSFFGAISQLGRLLPGYIEGERAAIKDNWNDLEQFNKNLNAEMSNALNALTFEDQARSVRDQAAMIGDQSSQSYMNLFNNYLGWGNQLAGTAALTPEQTMALKQALYNVQMTNAANAPAQQSLLMQFYQNAINNRLNPNRSIGSQSQPVAQPANPFNIY